MKYLTDKADGQFKKTASNAKLRTYLPDFKERNLNFIHYINKDGVTQIKIRPSKKFMKLKFLAFNLKKKAS